VLADTPPCNIATQQQCPQTHLDDTVVVVLLVTSVDAVDDGQGHVDVGLSTIGGLLLAVAVVSGLL
jgi:hypothetical protein